MAICVIAGRRRSAMPVLLPGREPDHVARPDLLDRSALALHPAAAGGDDQRLAQRMGVPRGARARLEGDAGAGDPGGIGRAEQRIDPHRAGETVLRTFAGGLGSYSLDVHLPSPSLLLPGIRAADGTNRFAVAQFKSPVAGIRR